ncbi:MAG TPA: DNA translocase FtsK [Dehalococcoidia bacterium]|nr:DNA translocase FtsK [Dehalococcoidia bacterium]
MAVRTRPKRGRTSRRSSPRRSSYRSASRVRRTGGPEIYIRTSWLIIGLAALAVVSLPLTGPYLLAGLEATLRRFGLGLMLLLAVLLTDAWLFLRQPLEPSRSFWRMLGGAHLLILTLFGVMGLWKPDLTIAGAPLAQVSSGGSLGHALVASPLGLLAWATVTAGAVTLLWPRGARATGNATLAGLRWLVVINIPAHIWHGLKAFLGILVPASDDDDIDLDAEPRYLPQWDEQWADSQPPAKPAGTEAEPLVVTSAGDDVEEFQRPLPFGRQAGGGWELPPIDILSDKVDEDAKPLDNEARARLIIETLRSFGVDATVATINQGPTVTQFGVEPGWEVKTRTVAERDERGRQVFDKDGKARYRTEVVSRTRVRVNKITTLANDLALALAAPTIRIEAPVPGQPIIGIEVPNTTTSLVTLRSVIESSAFARMGSRTRLGIALGKGVSGEPVAADLTKMPHLLIAGATGSGKSVCINSVIACLLMNNAPEDLRLILVDPKRVELANFADIPHLAFSKVITELDEVPATLHAIIQEMENRYRKFAEIGVRNLEAWNRSARATHKLPYWVVIIDELADLMMAAPYQVEKQLCRLAQLARATGIHLIIATQRPSVDVVTGLIKANFPTRIAFAVSSQVDSRTIIDMAGADKLLGRGDMLFMATDAAKPRRLQGCFVSDGELDKLVAWWTEDRFRHLKPESLDHLLQQAGADDEEEPAEFGDPLYQAALNLARQHSRISTSLLQRRLHVGYPRAANLIDSLEREGVVGPPEGGGGSRQVLISSEDDDELDPLD